MVVAPRAATSRASSGAESTVWTVNSDIFSSSVGEGSAAAAPGAGRAAEAVVRGLDDPVRQGPGVEAVDGERGRLYVTDSAGRLRVLDGGATPPEMTFEELATKNAGRVYEQMEFE